MYTNCVNHVHSMYSCVCARVFTLDPSLYTDAAVSTGVKRSVNCVGFCYTCIHMSMLMFMLIFIFMFMLIFMFMIVCMCSCVYLRPITVHRCSGLHRRQTIGSLSRFILYVYGCVRLYAYIYVYLYAYACASDRVCVCSCVHFTPLIVHRCNGLHRSQTIV